MIIGSLLVLAGISFLFLIFALGVLHLIGIFNDRAYQMALKLEIFISKLPLAIKKILKFIIKLPKKAKRALIFKRRLMVNRIKFHHYLNMRKPTN